MSLKKWHYVIEGYSGTITGFGSFLEKAAPDMYLASHYIVRDEKVFPGKYCIINDTQLLDMKFFPTALAQTFYLNSKGIITHEEEF